MDTYRYCAVGPAAGSMRRAKSSADPLRNRSSSHATFFGPILSGPGLSFGEMAAAFT